MCNNNFIWIIIAWLVLGNGNGNGGCVDSGNYTQSGCGCAARRAATTCGCDAAETDCVRVVRNNGCGC